MTATHPLDRVSLGKIVQVRERLMASAARGMQVFRLESGDPGFDVAPHIRAAMDEALRAGRTHYGPTTGIPELRAALRRKLARVNGIALPDDGCVVVTNGAMHALYVTFAALLSPGDQVLLPDPMWTEVAEHVRLAGGVAVGVPLRVEEGFRYDPAEIRRRVTPATRAIFVNTPHNPTGAVLDEATLLAILQVADDHGLWVISDEAYEDLVFAPARHVSPAAVAQRHFGAGSPLASRVASIFSFSKSHAMSGLRVGAIASTHALLRERLPKAIRCTINNVNGVAQWGALAALDGPRDHVTMMRETYLERRAILLEALTGLEGVRPFTPPGGFFVWATLDPALYARLGVADAEALCDRLADLGIGSAPGNAFAVGDGTHGPGADVAGAGCADALRFAFAGDTAMVREGAARLRAVLGGDSLHRVADAVPASAVRVPRLAGTTYGTRAPHARPRDHARL